MHRLLTALPLTVALALAGCAKSTTPEPAATTAEASALPGGIVEVASATPAEGEIGLAYTKYRLPNGLTVVLHEDDSDPLVHVDVTYHVGSGREEIGRSGFAHFFEHMMFQGSEHVGDEQHFKIITESGGTLNGTTNSDRTNYYETVPSNQLEKMLWLEADRMGFLLDAVTEEKFEVQRETVKNERGQRVDNAPYGLLGERVSEAMFPEGHPYSWSVIGYMEDLDRADLTDLKRFFLRWYGPNNAVLTIGGDFDKQQTLEWVAKYFGSIPEGPAVEPPVYEPVTLDADRYISMEDNVALPLVYMAWPTVHARHPDEAPLDVLMNILGVGKTSLLYKNLVKDGTAVQAQAGHGCQELHCEFTLLALPNPETGKNLADIEKVLRDSLVEFEGRGVEADDLQRVKAGIVADMVFGLESVSGKVSTLAANETFAGEPNYVPQDIARYEGVTAEDVVRVYETYIKGKPAVIMSVVPKGQLELIAHEDTWQRYERTIPERSDEGELAMRRPTDDFDRAAMPPAGANPTITPPPIWHGALSNGIEVIGAVNDETPTTALRIQLEVGQRNEPLEKLGLAQLTAGMLDEATTESTVEDLSNRLDKIGASISVSSGNRSTYLTVRTLTEHLDEAVAILAEKLRKPAFAEADFERLKAQTLQGIEVSKTEPAVTASNVFTAQLYGTDNAWAHPDEGRTDTVKAITLDDVKAFYADRYGANVASVLVVSDLPQEQLTPKLAFLEDWAEVEVAEVTDAPYPELAAGTLYLIDKEGAAQSEVRLGKRAMAWDATGDYYRSNLMNYPIGGAFNSRINLNLREDKGYTYGARGRFSGSLDHGHYVASGGIRTDATAKALIEFESELAKAQAEGLSEEEVAFTKSSIGQSEAREYETPNQKLGYLDRVLTYDLADDYVTEQAQILRDITKAELDALAAKHLDPKQMIVVVVGDQATIREELEGLGHPIVELNTDGSTKNPTAKKKAAPKATKKP